MGDTSDDLSGALRPVCVEEGLTYILNDNISTGHQDHHKPMTSDKVQKNREVLAALSVATLHAMRSYFGGKNIHYILMT